MHSITNTTRRCSAASNVDVETPFLSSFYCSNTYSFLLSCLKSSAGPEAQRYAIAPGYQDLGSFLDVSEFELFDVGSHAEGPLVLDSSYLS